MKCYTASMRVFDHIAIIFNPKSTGDAAKMAKDLCDSVNGYHEVIKTKALLYPTKHAGHATEIADMIVRKHDKPLLVSVSGDGGYNEVINGAMTAKLSVRGAQPVVAVMAAGNANDHKRVTRGEVPLIRLIKRAQIKPLDLLEIIAKAPGFELRRFAHSYIGLGITSEVGKQLNRSGKGLINEIRVIAKTFGKFEPFIVDRDGVQEHYDSLVFANINEMAKVVQLDDTKTIRDGKFEVVSIKHRGKLHLATTVAGAALSGFSHSPSYQTYSFRLLDAQPIQLDGEIEHLPDNCAVTIKSRAVAIDSLY